MIGVLRVGRLERAPMTWRRGVFNLSKLKSAVAKTNARVSHDTQKYTIHKRFGHPQERMYALISRVDLYEEFIPYCTSSFVRETSPVTGEPTLGGLRVGFQTFDEEFMCELACDRPGVVDATSISHSLFHFLETKWTIKALEGGQCEATLDLKYEFKSALYNTVSRLFASKVASLMTKAFEERAAQVAGSEQLQEAYEAQTVAVAENK